MTARTRAILLALSACHRAAPSARQRALAELPAGPRIVAAADGAALAAPAFRRVVDLSRAHAPASFGCVIDAALASDAVAAAIDPTGVALVIVAHAKVAPCPALSRTGPETYVATIGAGALAVPGGPSVVAAPRWDRARAYLEQAPVALAGDLDGRRLLAAAQPDPIDAWVSIDAADATLVEIAAAAVVARQHLPSGKLRVSRDRDQVVVRGEALVTDDLAAIATELWSELDVTTARAVDPPSCPPPGTMLLRCTAGTRYAVAQLGPAIHVMTWSAAQPVVRAAEVIGLRLTDDTELGLRKGDILLGWDGRRLTTPEQLAALVREAKGHVSLAVRRGDDDLVFEVSEP